LTGLTVSVPVLGNHLSVLDLLYETNQNLNEILFDEKYNFEKLIQEENGESSEEITYESLENLYVSPAVRRGVWQALCMADEYVRAIGSVPDKIFIEVTREEGQKGDLGRTQSRKNRLLDLYKNLEGYADICEELKKEEISYRNFLVDMLTYSTEKYPTRKDLVAKTQDLYAVNIYTKGYRIGRFESINFFCTFLNEKYRGSYDISMLNQLIDNNIVNSSYLYY